MNSVQGVADAVYAKAGIRNITLGGNTYSIKLLSAFKGFAVGMKLIKTCLPALGAYFDSDKREEYMLPEEESLFTEMALLLVTQTDKLDIEDIIETITKDSLCNGTPIDVDEHFRGDLKNFMELLQFSLKENFGGLFTDFLKEKGLSLPTLGMKETETQDSTPAE